MGCGASQPVNVEKPVTQNAVAQQPQPAAAAAETAAPAAADPAAASAGNATSSQESSQTRARRLSLVPGPGAATQGSPTQPEEIGASNSAVRMRRLSYVSAGQGADGVHLPGDGKNNAYPEVQRALQFNPDNLPTDGERDLGVEVVCISRAGQDPGLKKQNQDNCFAFDFYLEPDQSLFSALDGHGPNGHMVSGYIKQHIPELLVQHLKAEEDNIPAALTEGFLEVDERLASSYVDCEFSGSTAVVSLLKGRMLYTAWVGDSRAVLGRDVEDGVEGIDLTIDHKPDDPEEKRRIQARNGRVERLVDEGGEPIGPPRVWLQYAWIPGLAMSRALGDKIAHTVGVISEPGISVLELFPADKFIILASDGVWEFIGSQEAVEIINAHEKLEDGVTALIDEAYARWLQEEEGVVDDITATVVKFIHKT